MLTKETTKAPVHLYDQLLEDQPDHVTVLRNRDATYVADGSYDLAVGDYDRLIRLESGNAQFYYNRGCAHLAAGHLDAALADYSKAIQCDDGHLLGGMAYNNRGITYARRAEYERALANSIRPSRSTPTMRPIAYRNRTRHTRTSASKPKRTPILPRPINCPVKGRKRLSGVPLTSQCTCRDAKFASQRLACEYLIVRHPCS